MVRFSLTSFITVFFLMLPKKNWIIRLRSRKKKFNSSPNGVKIWSINQVFRIHFMLKELANPPQIYSGKKRKSKSWRLEVEKLLIFDGITKVLRSMFILLELMDNRSGGYICCLVLYTYSLILKLRGFHGYAQYK